MENSKVLLDVKDLKIYYPIKYKAKGSFFRKKGFVKAVDGISFQVHEGETFGIVGESGCGKSTTGHAIVRLLKPYSGSIRFEGRDIFAKEDGADKKEWAKKIEIIFQDPYSSLDPRFTVGRCIEEPLKVHGMGSAKERKEKVLSLMHDVGLAPENYTKFPHEFSGGQRQRIGVARALTLNPSIIVCDEPVSALDVSIQAQILNLMQDLQKKYHLSYIFISHNLSVVNHICDRIAVMYLGHIVELAEKDELFDNPKHPYTQALLDVIPIPDPKRKSLTRVLEGDVPSQINPPSGCCFHTRCPSACERCKREAPASTEISPGHFVACHLYDGKGGMGPALRENKEKEPEV
ncbi:MAG TPA: dipeptide ABC transporter ATP-binding protein [Candidatus Caccousia avistercoris]|nr:dipeptide ABC transporter ATP-binding protein [Candidatus Caccousia avistercoris]